MAQKSKGGLGIGLGGAVAALKMARLLKSLQALQSVSGAVSGAGALGVGASGVGAIGAGAQTGLSAAEASAMLGSSGTGATSAVGAAATPTLGMVLAPVAIAELLAATGVIETGPIGALGKITGLIPGESMTPQQARETIAANSQYLERIQSGPKLSPEMEQVATAFGNPGRSAQMSDAVFNMLRFADRAQVNKTELSKLISQRVGKKYDVNQLYNEGLKRNEERINQMRQRTVEGYGE